MTNRRPNVVLIVLDSVRRDHVSGYGYERPTTPTIDALAESGVLYDKAYATSCWTLPSHASIFTSLYPSDHRCDLDTYRLSPVHSTIAGELAQAGYATASVSCNGFVAPGTGLTSGFEYAVDVEALAGSSSGILGRVTKSLHQAARKRLRSDRGARRATALARKWIRQKTAEPFFLFINFMECHQPYRLDHPDRWMFVDPADRQSAANVALDPLAAMAGQLSYSEAELEWIRAQYDGCLRHLDGQVALIRDELSVLGLLENTLLIVTSDHGESFGEHGLFDHQFGLWEHLVGVPLVMSWPAALSGGRRKKALVQHVDLMPTILEAAGSSTVRCAPYSHSLLGSTEREFALFEYRVPNLKAFQRRFPAVDVGGFDQPLRGVTDGTHRLLVSPGGTSDLFKVGNVPATQVSEAEVDSAEIERLGAAIDLFLGPWTSASPEDSSPEGMEEMRSRLQALGYL